MTSNTLRLSVCLLVIVLLCPAVSFAQATAGSSLFGTVTDPGGSAVPDVEVRITSTATNAERIVTTNSEGHYVAPQLPAGTYSIQVSKPGFNVAKATGILIQTNETVRRNFQLELGA